MTSGLTQRTEHHDRPQDELSMVRQCGATVAAPCVHANLAGADGKHEGTHDRTDETCRECAHDT